MSLLDLARKFLRPGYKAEGDEEAAAEAEFRTKAGKVWLDYHNNELWARRKLEAGLTLTPEGLDYMEREVETRKLAAEHADNIKKEIEAENAAPIPPTPAGDSESAGIRGSDGTGAGGALPPGS